MLARVARVALRGFPNISSENGLKDGDIVVPSHVFNQQRLFLSLDMNTVELGKKTAAVSAVDDFVENNHKIGIGSGSTIVYAVERLAARVKEEKLQVVCVPTSFQARQCILDNNLPLSDLEQHPYLDVAIDGADEVDSEKTCIKGGGGCLLQEKVVASCANTFVIIADEKKQANYLGERWLKGVPLEVLPLAYRPVQLRIERQLGGTAPLRMASNKAGPVVTDNGNFILDWKFEPPKTKDWRQVDQTLKKIPGVIETGLFVGMAKFVYFGTCDGEVKKLD